MSATEEQLQKLKVTELKELLAKHGLAQTGKKDDLVKRLVENNISPDAEEELEDLAEPPADATGESYSAAPAAPAAPSGGESLLTSAEDAPVPVAPAAPELTPEQQAMKARAERFGVPFNPNPTPSAKSTPAVKPAAAPTTDAKPKAGAIDKASVGISDETLAKRAARFGLPEKKAEEPKKAAAPVSAAKPKSAAAELTPEQAAKQAEDEEKKRKRAEKFGAASEKPASSEAEPVSLLR
ncbi:uncharacterized protein MKK02DRAFT_38672 [Dioszegia hungarica]|uniref:SAP domain-containing protein n=1 Tax=Dioszegia hungarica TaxID=4972 RepID=A0AA38H4W9_9TREE|nr:uncharacterized protein MKK02DRAFT_38672 [Dioszegia hungarica]KAI9634000.1 hypothetical protein MKK02DRAFT_38672 [Dioszegia hungarica]